MSLPIEHLDPPSLDHAALLTRPTPISASRGFEGKTEANPALSRESCKTAGSCSTASAAMRVIAQACANTQYKPRCFLPRPKVAGSEPRPPPDQPTRTRANGR